MAAHLLVTFNKMVEDAASQARGGAFRISACADTFRLIVGSDSEGPYLVLDGKGRKNLAADAAIMAHLRAFEGDTRVSSSLEPLQGMGLVTAWHAVASETADGGAVHLREQHATTLAAPTIRCVRAVANVPGAAGLDVLVKLGDLLLLTLERDSASVDLKQGGLLVTHSHAAKLDDAQMHAVQRASVRGPA